MPAKYAVVDSDLRFAMALLFLVSATTKVMETTAIQVYMHVYGVPGMLVWPAACFEYAAGLFAYSSAIGSARWRSGWRGGAC